MAHLAIELSDVSKTQLWYSSLENCSDRSYLTETNLQFKYA
ncbi:MAG: hypothetical protein RMY16_31515 [Nostoc sp. DedQUE12b]|nr:hypothetical protein [Nostoc sp. DedQUE12b]MDZ8089566.1 hypothetical protein [Nostoc sp. DedQUE12b]MDZ8090049.1 hypothetical protein [Nostoc sp. DedQUE12b]